MNRNAEPLAFCWIRWLAILTLRKNTRQIFAGITVIDCLTSCAIANTGTTCVPTLRCRQSPPGGKGWGVANGCGAAGCRGWQRMWRHGSSEEATNEEEEEEEE
eukprot:SAG11_NODE_13674_length_644_cov_0.871560_1_plen_102_part_01